MGKQLRDPPHLLVLTQAFLHAIATESMEAFSGDHILHDPALARTRRAQSQGARERERTARTGSRGTRPSLGDLLEADGARQIGRQASDVERHHVLARYKREAPIYLVRGDANAGSELPHLHQEAKTPSLLKLAQCTCRQGTPLVVDNVHGWFMHSPPNAEGLHDGLAFPLLLFEASTRGISVNRHTVTIAVVII